MIRSCLFTSKHSKYFYDQEVALDLRICGLAMCIDNVNLFLPHQSQKCRQNVQVAAKDADFQTLKTQFEQLKADFLHNEGVVRERDDELSALEHRLSCLSSEADSLRQAATGAEAANALLQEQLNVERRR